MRRHLKLNLGLAVAICVGGATTVSWGQAPEAPHTDELVHGNDAFAVELYKRLSTEEGNLFFSPESISTALGMVYAGARGDTASEIAKALHFTLPQDQVFPAMAALLQQLAAGAKGGEYQLNLANGLWIQKNLPLLPSFSHLVKDNYGAQFDRVDFHDPERARTIVNKWVEEQTAGKITDLLPKDAVDAMTRLVLANAIYFKGDWATQFNPAATAEMDFHTGSASQVRAKLMRRNGSFGYFKGETFSALQIPYKGNQLSMVVFLPDAPDGLQALEQALKPGDLETWIGGLKAEELTVLLPKFTMRWGTRLCPVLEGMGMKLAFDSTAADLSGITGQRGLSVNAVVHKAYVDVNEQGTEAAAATGVGIRAMAFRRPALIFRADHPFLFVIRDNKSGSLLFMGRVTDPTK